MPISSESEYVMQHNQWIKHHRSQGQCKGPHQLDESTKKLEWIGEPKQADFQVTVKCNITSVMSY